MTNSIEFFGKWSFRELVLSGIDADFATKYLFSSHFSRSTRFILPRRGEKNGKRLLFPPKKSFGQLRKIGRRKDSGEKTWNCIHEHTSTEFVSKGWVTWKKTWNCIICRETGSSTIFREIKDFTDRPPRLTTGGHVAKWEVLVGDMSRNWKF